MSDARAPNLLHRSLWHVCCRRGLHGCAGETCHQLRIHDGAELGDKGVALRQVVLAALRHLVILVLVLRAVSLILVSLCVCVGVLVRVGVRFCVVALLRIVVPRARAVISVGPASGLLAILLLLVASLVLVFVIIVRIIARIFRAILIDLAFLRAWRVRVRVRVLVRAETPALCWGCLRQRRTRAALARGLRSASNDRKQLRVWSLLRKRVRTSARRRTVPKITSSVSESAIPLVIQN
jgi:hypothetical protein